MHLPQFRVRTLMFVVWLSALALVGTVDLLEEYRKRNRVEVINEHIGVDGSRTATLLFSHSTFYYFGPLPIGPCPIAVLSGVAFVASIMVWTTAQRRKKQT